MTKNFPLNLGLIGCGGFGTFCLEAYSGLEEISITAVADIDESTAKRTGDRHDVAWYTDSSLILRDPEIDFVHIATPPHTHYSLCMQALENSKHVLCEKPLALTFAEGIRLVKLAKQQNKVLAVDFVLRYVPIVDIVKKIIQSNVFGLPLHAYFENYAADEELTPDHWFWDLSRSGGIFIEHGVHFFDLYRYWFGETEILWAHSEKRSGNLEDRVFCVLGHENGVLSNHYHGFDQPGYLDRQTHRILFETGDLTVNGWIPISLSVNGIVDKKEVEILTQICPDAKINTLEDFSTTDQQMKGRGKEIKASKHIELIYKSPNKKMQVYAQAVRNLLKDQISYILEPTHQRVITEDNGLKALELAQQATTRKDNHD